MKSPIDRWSSQIESLSREFYRTLDFAHDVSHGERVVENAKMLAEAENADTPLVTAGAWLHQFHDHLPLLCERLKAIDLDPTLAAHLAEIVEYCRPLKISEGSSIEARIVFDADALDLIGPLGTVRELLCNFSHRQLSWSESVSRCRETQGLFREKISTASGRRQAEIVSPACELFWRTYDLEKRRGKD